MAYEGIGLPADGVGKKVASRKGIGAGPSGADVYFEVDAVQPDNAVGPVLVSQPLGALPTTLTAVISVTVALDFLFLVNVDTVARTVEMTDGSGTPIKVLPPGFELPKGGFLAMRFGGIEVLNGLKWQAPSGGVNGALIAYKAS